MKGHQPEKVDSRPKVPKGLSSGAKKIFGCDGTEIKPEYDGLDNPEHDGTDLAHPAWWRGCDSGADSTVVVIHQMLDDIEAGKEKAGTFGSQKLNMLRDRLYQMYGK